MVTIEFDESRRLLRIGLSGHVTEEQLKSGLKRIQSMLPGLDPEFWVLTDLSDLESMEVSCAPHIEAKMDLLKQKPLRAVARVIPDPHKDIGFEIMSLFHYRDEVPTATFETIDEAMNYLTS